MFRKKTSQRNCLFVFVLLCMMTSYRPQLQRTEAHHLANQRPLCFLAEISVKLQMQRPLFQDSGGELDGDRTTTVMPTQLRPLENRA